MAFVIAAIFAYGGLCDDPCEGAVEGAMNCAAAACCCCCCACCRGEGVPHAGTAPEREEEEEEEATARPLISPLVYCSMEANDAEGSECSFDDESFEEFDDSYEGYDKLSPLRSSPPPRRGLGDRRP